MKTLKIFLLTIVLSLVATAAFSAPASALKKDKDPESVSVKPTHYKNLLILKAGKPFMGAAVEVHDEKGALIATSYIHKKKMIIDFYDIPNGSYTIHVIKNKKTILEFNHIKKQDSEIFN